MKLLLVRHGETHENLEKRYLGQRDVPLNTRGEEQAYQLGTQLRDESLDVIVTSSLQRARATAAAIARYHDVPVYEDVDLREMARGVWEGRTQEEVKAGTPDILACWKKTPTRCQIEGAETLYQVRERVVSALERWQARYPQGTVVWVTHAGVIQVLCCHVQGVHLDEWRRFYPANCAVTALAV